MKATAWEKYINPETTAPLAHSGSSTNSIKSALDLDLDAQWELREHISKVQQLTRNARQQPEQVTYFFNTIDTETSLASPDLIASLMELALKSQMPEKAVEFFVWGRQTDNLPPVDSLLALLSAIRGLPEWKFVRQRLTGDLQTYYPSYVSHKLKITAITGKENKYLASSSSSSSSSSTSLPSEDSTLAPDADSTTPSSFSDASNSGVGWVDFVSNPSSFNDISVMQNSALGNIRLTSLRKDQARLEAIRTTRSLAMGDRRRRLKLEVKSWTEEQLSNAEIEDNVVLTVVIEEMIARGLKDAAIELLKREIDAKRYLISTEPFNSLAAYFKEKLEVNGVLSLLQMMMQQNLAPDIFLINILLDLHVSVGNIQEATDLWFNLYDLGVVPNSTTLGTAIRLLNTAVSRQKRITLTLSTLLRTAQKYKIEFNDASYTQLLKYAVAVNNNTFAQSVFVKIKHPNYVSYCQILLVYLRTRQSNKFIETFNILESRLGAQIDHDALFLAREALIHMNRPQSLIPLMRTQILKHQYKPDMKEFQSHWKAIIKSGHILAAIQLDQLRLELCPHLKYISAEYAEAILHHHVASLLKPSVYSLSNLKVWALSTIKSPSHPPAEAIPTGSETLDPFLTQAWNHLISTWVEKNGETLRRFDAEESTRVREVIHDKREKAIKERRILTQEGLEQLRAVRDSSKKSSYRDQL